MNIQSNSNIASTMANSINLLKMNNAIKGFEQAKTELEPKEDEITKEQEQAKQEDLAMDAKSFKSSFNFDEIKQFASQIGETVSDEDIQYGLMYGRSVLADYSA